MAGFARFYLSANFFILVFALLFDITSNLQILLSIV